MESLAKSLWRKITVLLGFAAVVVINGLAATGQINSMSPADISAKYPTLFTPEPYTFSIWGIIYVLLAVYVMFQLFSTKMSQHGMTPKIAFWFVVSCLTNIGWVFAWHYDQILISTIIMVVLLYCLLRILMLVADMEHTLGHIVSLELPFGLYSGWITVATVANLSVLLVSLGWDGFGIPTYLWLIAVLLIATFLAVTASRKTLNIGYPAAVIWGFIGILTRYLPDFKVDINLDIMWIVITLGLCLLVLAIRWIDVLSRRLK